MRENPYLHIDQHRLPSQREEPLEIALLRGNGVESFHRIHIVVRSDVGKTEAQWGSEALPTFARSVLKPLQASLWFDRKLIESGAIQDSELALACASHHGEEEHVNNIQSWAKRRNISLEYLECGAHYPFNRQAEIDLIQAKKEPCPIHNNCSGKHLGMLLHCRELDYELQGYSNYSHPLQVDYRRYFTNFFELSFDKLQWGIDGCGIPTYQIPLGHLADYAYRLASPKNSGAEYAEKFQLINKTMKQNSFLVGGSNSFCTKVSQSTDGRVLAKIGAEGVYLAWIEQLKLGICLKVEDGHERAAKAALGFILREYGFDVTDQSFLNKRWSGEVVGQYVSR
ncbi:MAG: asparaginase [Oligoflexia bacterium]|nr:asparaginase [Oligoflexia bacterium]